MDEAVLTASSFERASQAAGHWRITSRRGVAQAFVTFASGKEESKAFSKETSSKALFHSFGILRTQLPHLSGSGLSQASHLALSKVNHVR